jgi:hypothetical protein
VQNVKDALKDPAKAKQLEEDSGMTRDQIEQFVKRFEKPKQPAAGPGGEITAEQGKDRTFDPNRSIADPIRQGVVSGRRERAAGSVAQDQISGQSQGTRVQPPAEWRTRFEAYQNTISGAAKPPAAPATTKDSRPNSP